MKLALYQKAAHQVKLRDIMNLCMGKPDGSEGGNSKRQRLE